MSSQQLHSLDVLLLSVRDPESKRLTQDAVAAYQGGALRASVLSIWVAVCADLIAKLRELANSGDANAATKVADLDNWIATRNTAKFLDFENNIIEIAKSQFEILSPHEATDLERLREDRHLCAHPAFISDDVLFSPTAEQVRTHIVHAIVHLLSRAPVQGKQLVARFDRDLTGGTVPRSAPDIETALRKNYLARAKPSAALTLMKALARALTGGEALKYKGKEGQIADALAALGRILPAEYEQHIPLIAEKISVEAQEDRLLNLGHYIQSDSRIWGWLGDAGQARYLAKIDSAPFPETEPAFFGRNVPAVADRLVGRLAAESLQVREDFLIKFPCRAFVPEAIKLYQSSGSYATAERRGAAIVIPHSRHFTAEDLGALNIAIRTSRYNQILDASESATILLEIFGITKGLLPAAAQHWTDIATYIVARNMHEQYKYPELIAELTNAGVAIPAASAD